MHHPRNSGAQFLGSHGRVASEKEAIEPVGQAGLDQLVGRVLDKRRRQIEAGDHQLAHQIIERHQSGLPLQECRQPPASYLVGRGNTASACNRLILHGRYHLLCKGPGGVRASSGSIFGSEKKTNVLLRQRARRVAALREMLITISTDPGEGGPAFLDSSLLERGVLVARADAQPWRERLGVVMGAMLLISL